MPDVGSFLLNGFIFSLIGLYDSWKLHHGLIIKQLSLLDLFDSNI